MRHARVTQVKSGLLTLAVCIGLAAAVPAGAQTNAFVVSTTANTVTVINTATSTVRGVVPVGTAPSRVAASPDGAWAYVSHPGLAVVSEIDAATLAVTRTLPAAMSPGAVAVSPNGQYLFVGTAGGVQVLNLPSGDAVGSIALPGVITDMEFTRDGGRVYVAAGVLSVINVATSTVTTTSVPASSLAVMPDGLRVYAASASGLSEVDAQTNAVVAGLPVSGTPGALALTPDESRLYAGVQGFTLISSVYGTFSVAFRNVTVFETHSRNQIATISISAPAARMAVAPDRRDLYMTIPNSAVAVASVNTNALRLTIPVGAGVNGLAIRPDPVGGANSRPGVV